METGQTLTIYTSIWSSKYKLKTKNYVSFSKEAVNSSNIPKKELALQRNLDEENSNEHTSSELHNNPTVPCNRLSECQDSDENAILDMYNLNQDAKLIFSAEKKEEEYLCFAEKNMSPELFKSRNPFVKRVSDLTTSPSVLFNGNCRRKGKNLMRIRRTIIDENIIVESKYFSTQDNEKHNVCELENKRIEDVLKNTECNIIPETSNNTYDTRANQELETLSIAEIANSVKAIDDAILSDQNECLTNTFEDISEKSYSNYSMSQISHCTTIDKDYVLDKFLLSSNTESTNDSINYENANSLQDNLSKCLNIKDYEVSLDKKEIFKKRSSVNLVNTNLCEQVLLELKEKALINFYV